MTVDSQLTAVNLFQLLYVRFNLIKKKMKTKQFIERYILPYEEPETVLKYYKGLLSFDDDYLNEKANYLNIKTK